MLEIPRSEQNENALKRFLKKFHQFTGNKYDTAVKYLTKKLKSLFPLKDLTVHPSAKCIKVFVVVEKLTLLKPIVKLKNICRNIILLTIN